jgi:hypothetical protein
MNDTFLAIIGSKYSTVAGLNEIETEAKDTHRNPTDILRADQRRRDSVRLETRSGERM